MTPLYAEGCLEADGRSHLALAAEHVASVAAAESGMSSREEGKYAERLVEAMVAALGEVEVPGFEADDEDARFDAARDAEVEAACDRAGRS